jgi:hypothetical protein
MHTPALARVPNTLAVVRLNQDMHVLRLPSFTPHASASLLRRHKLYLFQYDGCMRADQATCLPESSAFRAVSHHGLDPMVQRLRLEAEVMSLEPPGTTTPNSTRWAQSSCSSQFSVLFTSSLQLVYRLLRYKPQHVPHLPMTASQARGTFVYALTAAAAAATTAAGLTSYGKSPSMTCMMG